MSIEVINLSCTYNRGLPTENTALSNISFTAKEGEILSVVGHTGSGKSTLAMHLNALMIPQSGDILIDGISALSEPNRLREIRKKVGLVFQYPEQQIFAETVEEEISFGPRNWGFSEEEINIRVRKAIEAIGLSSDLMDKNPFALSGGQKRRVALASVFASSPSYTVMDEPTAGLDFNGKKDLIRIMKEQKANGMGIIHITHDLELALVISDKILILESGRTVTLGTPYETALYIGSCEIPGLTVPPILKLSKTLKDRGIIDTISWNPRELARTLARKKGAKCLTA